MTAAHARPRARPSRLRRVSRPVTVIAVAAAVASVLMVPAIASARPVVLGLSTHHGPYWGGTPVTITGVNFTGLRTVTFGSKTARSVHLISPGKLEVVAPLHAYGTVDVRVVTAAGSSARSSATRFTLTRPTMNDPIQGGLTARQEQRISAKVRSHHHNVHVARRSRHWTAAMGVTAAHRARSWLGVPYSWAGGNGSGPTTGVCAHNGGDLDCHVVGFDCSGLTLYAWWPYEHLAHYAATQHHQAGRFHPAIGELTPGDLVYFAGYIRHGIGHTAVYVGGGTVIEAPESGKQVARARLSDVIARSGPYRGATRPMSTGKQGVGPHVTSVTRTVSARGGTITITGRGLAATTSVRIGDATRYGFAARSAHRLVVRAPAHSVGRVTVAVSNAWDTAHRTLTYVAAPAIAALTPATGTTAGGNTVTVSGQHLSSATKAIIDGRSVALRGLTATRAIFTAPAHAAGTVRITLVSPFGTSNALGYTYEAVAAPTTSTSPSSGSPTTSTGTSTSATSPPSPSGTSTSATPSSQPTSAPPSTGVASSPASTGSVPSSSSP